MTPPDPPRPMPFRAFGWGIKFLLLFGGIWFAVGVLLTSIFLLIGRPFWVDTALDERGISTQAEVVAVRRTHSTVNRQPVFAIEIAFQGTAGRYSAVLPTHAYGAIRSAQTERVLSIEYDPEDPSVVRLQGGSASVFGRLALIPAPFGLIGGGLLVIAFLLALGERRSYVHGEAVQAEVIEVKGAVVKQNTRTLRRALYRYTVQGQAYEGSLQRVEPPAKGDKIWVYYDPQRPERSIAS